jgi:hypothetical protein
MNMQTVKTEMQIKAFEAFLAAHGLSHNSTTGLISTPTGQEVAFAIRTAGVLDVRLMVYEESYQIDETEVKSWWPMARPSYVISDFDGNVIEIGPPLGPNEVICDFCSAEIHTRPVPVVDGNALCPECFAETRLPFPGSVQPYEVEEDEND